MASIITATTTSGLTQSADNSGVLQLASGVGNLVTIPAVTGTAMVSGNMPAFSATGASGQSIPASTFTKIVLGTERFDTANAFDSTTNYRFTPQVEGYYQINAAVGSTTTGVMIVSIYKNGTELQRGNQILGDVSIREAVVSGLVYLNGSTDYIELYFFQGAVTAQNTAGGSVGIYMNGSLVRAA
jgi:hypothetical protein